MENSWECDDRQVCRVRGMESRWWWPLVENGGNAEPQKKYKFRREVERRWTGQARVAEDGLEAEVATGARVVPMDQEGLEQTSPLRGNQAVWEYAAEETSVGSTASRGPEVSSATSEGIPACSTALRRPKVSSAASEEVSAGSTASRRPGLF